MLKNNSTGIQSINRLHSNEDEINCSGTNSNELNYKLLFASDKLPNFKQTQYIVRH